LFADVASAGLDLAAGRGALPRERERNPGHGRLRRRVALRERGGEVVERVRAGEWQRRRRLPRRVAPAKVGRGRRREGRAVAALLGAGQRPAVDREQRDGARVALALEVDEPLK
jgi:hypothetical protein